MHRLMSISEAILAGSRERPQGKPDRFFTWASDHSGKPICMGSDSLGAVYEAVVGSVHHDEDYVYERLHEYYGHALYSTKLKHPSGNGEDITLEEAIYEFEKMGWTREAISQWIASNPEWDLEN
jgi:hypothetical protein